MKGRPEITRCILLDRYNDLETRLDEGSMPVTVEMQHAGGPSDHADVRAVIEHVLADRTGNWRVSIVGSQANDRWEMTILGSYGFERSYTLEGSVGEHDPGCIGSIVARMVPT
jgi:hypothetical protein